MSNAGRHPKWNRERCQAIARDIADGLGYDLAAYANGICPATLFNWLSEGKELVSQGVQNELTEFLESIKILEAEKKRRYLQTVAEAPERWQASAWLLERRWWKEYSSAAQVLDFEERLKKMEEASEKKDG